MKWRNEISCSGLIEVSARKPAEGKSLVHDVLDLRHQPFRFFQPSSGRHPHVQLYLTRVDVGKEILADSEQQQQRRQNHYADASENKPALVQRTREPAPVSHTAKFGNYEYVVTLNGSPIHVDEFKMTFEVSSVFSTSCGETAFAYSRPGSRLSITCRVAPPNGAGL
jgi:hypothetical protein